MALCPLRRSTSFRTQEPLPTSRLLLQRFLTLPEGQDRATRLRQRLLPRSRPPRPTLL
jgi:hypothetical protein